MKYASVGTTLAVACEFCGKPVDLSAPGFFRRVTGWIEQRKGGGANQVKLATAADGIAHAYCVKAQRKPDEPELFA